MNKTFVIIQREYATRVRKKSFIILTILMPFVFAALIFVPLWLSSIRETGQKDVVVVDKTGRYAHLFGPNDSYNFIPAAEEDNRYYASDSETEGVVVITDDLVRNPAAVCINSRKTVSADLLRCVGALLNEEVRRQKLEAYDVPQLNNIIADVETPIAVRTAIKNVEGDESLSDTGVAAGAGFLLTLLIYIFVMVYGAGVMQGVTEEKSNRIVELMVSSVRPFQLMMGKIIGVALVGFTQLLIWASLVGIILFICAGYFGVEVPADGASMMGGMGAPAAAMPTDSPAGLMAAILNLPYVELVVMFLLYFTGGYLLYASFFAAVGASVNAQEDSSQFMMPVTLIMLFGLYAGLYSLENTDGPLAFWTSLFPLTSPIVMMVRIPFGVPWWQEALSLGLLFLTVFFMIWLSGKIYRVGILMYGKKPGLKEMLKWVRYK